MIFLIDIGALYTILANDLKVLLANYILLLPISLGINIITSLAAYAVLRRIVLSLAPESRRANS
jgi:sensor histidine kinase regulating citrate/malate metabolism